MSHAQEHEMSETRKDFRHRINMVFADALKTSPSALGSFDMLQDQLEAVYAEALRDVIDLFDSRADNAESADSDEFRADLRACLAVIHFAAEKGITLGERP